MEHGRAVHGGAQGGARRGVAAVAAEAAPAEVWRWPRVPKKVWGPVGWRWLHLMAINYPYDPAVHELVAGFDRLWNFAAGLPCEECKREMLWYLTAYPPEMQNTASLQSWVWKFHNWVNVRLGKAAMTWAAYTLAYESELAEAELSREN